MQLVTVLFLAVWTLVVVRTLAMRATLSLRTLGTYLVLGALLGPIAWPMWVGFFNSYGSYQVYHWPLVVLGVQALLLSPLFGFLFLRRADQVTSVGDAFLLAYMIGFGYDLFCVLAGAATISHAGAVISLLPPFAFVRSDLTAAGFGAWSGMVALAVAAALRFLRTQRAVYTVGAVAALWVTAEMTGLIVSTNGGSGTLLATFTKITFGGALTSWATLFALVAVSLWEHRFVSPSTGTARAEAVLSQWSSLLSALARRNVREFQRLGSLFRLRRQAELTKWELTRSPSNPHLVTTLRKVDTELRLAESTPPQTSAAESPKQILAIWTKRQPLQVALVVAFVGIVLLLPEMPPISALFWRFSPLNAPLLLLNISLLDCGLIGVIAWRYLSAARESHSPTSANDILQFSGENLILQLALGTVVLALLYGKVEELYSLRGIAQLIGVMGTPNYDHAQLTTVMLLTAATATGLSLKGSDGLKKEAADVRRAAAVARVMSLFTFVAGAGVVILFFQHGQLLLHSVMGAILFSVFGRHANSAGDTFVGIVTIGFSFLVFGRLFAVSERVESFLTTRRTELSDGGR